MKKFIAEKWKYVLANCTWRLIWFLTILIALTIYVLCIWDYAIDFTPFSNFDGNNLLFVVWIVILLSPIVRLKVKGVETGLYLKDENPFNKGIETALRDSGNHDEIIRKMAEMKGEDKIDNDK